MKKPVSEIVVAVLDRPRHEDLIREIREAGAGTRLLLDGYVAASIHAASYGSRIDMCVGICGSPEGVVTACAITAMGGLMQGILMPRDEKEKQSGIDRGLKMDTSMRPTSWFEATTHFLLQPESPTEVCSKVSGERAQSSAPSPS